MISALQINKDIYDALVESFGEEVLKKKLDDILVSAIKNKLEHFSREILKFEEKYSVSFIEFEKIWENGKIENKYSYDVESDFMDWEMLEMEKRELLITLSKLKGLKKK